MYKILHFRGGLYKFDELVELVEDTGGIVLNENRFEIIRGVSYLCQEVHVSLIVPESELGNIKSFIKEIKGMVGDIEATEDQDNLFLSYFSIYDALNRIGGWANKTTLKEAISCPCYAELCTYFGEEKCQLDDLLEEILAEMCLSNILENRESENGKSEYRLKK